MLSSVVLLMSKLSASLLGFFIALGGACIAMQIKLPLPWMLGALLLTASSRIVGIGVACPKLFRSCGQWVIGTSLGLYFTSQVIGHITSNIVSIVAGMLFALLLALLGSTMLCWLAREDFKTAWFSAAIGGASEMANLAEKAQARTDRVATAHSVRLLLVVLAVPFIFQWWGVAGIDPAIPGARNVEPWGLVLLVGLTWAAGLAFQHFGLVNPWVLGPMAVAIALTSTGIELSTLPDFVPKVGQLFIGWSLGDRYRPDFLRSAPRFVAVLVLYTIVSLILAFGFGFLLSRWSNVPLPTLILGTTPGGIAEMSMTAKVLQLGVPTVTAFHVMRMVFVVMVTGPIGEFLARRYDKKIK